MRLHHLINSLSVDKKVVALRVMDTFHLDTIPLHSNLIIIGVRAVGKSTLVRHLLDALAPFDRRLLISSTHEFTQEYAPYFAAEEMHSRWREELGRTFIRQQLAANDCAMALTGSRGCLVLDDVDMRDFRPYPSLVQLMATEEKHRLQTTVMMTLQRVPSLHGIDHYHFMPHACVFLFRNASSCKMSAYFFSGANLWWSYSRFEDEMTNLAAYQCLVVVPSYGVYRYTVPTADADANANADADADANADADADADLPEIDLREQLTTSQVVGGVWVTETPTVAETVPENSPNDKASDEESDEQPVATAAAVLPPRRGWRWWPF